MFSRNSTMLLVLETEHRMQDESSITMEDLVEERYSQIYFIFKII